MEQEKMEFDNDELLCLYAHLRLLPNPNLKCLSIMAKIEKKLANFVDFDFLTNIENRYFKLEEK